MTNAVVADATAIGAMPFTSATVSNIGYGTEAGEDPDVTGYRTAWWKFTPDADMSLTLDTETSPGGPDTILALYRSSGPPHTIGTLTRLLVNDDDPGGGGVFSTIRNAPLDAGRLYFISVGGYSDEDLDYVLRAVAGPSSTYHPGLFLVERASSLSGRLGEFILGASLLGSAGDGEWTPVPAATFSYANGYTVNEDGTLIVDSESASIALSFRDTPGEILYPLDRIRVSYAGKVLFEGTVDSTSLKYQTDPGAADHGASRRVDFSATILGSYAVALSKTISYAGLPAEPAIDRIRRWVTVSNW